MFADWALDPDGRARQRRDSDREPGRITGAYR